MDSTVNDFIQHKGATDEMAGTPTDERRGVIDDRDCLMFHGVAKDEMEEGSGDDDIKKNFLDHNIKKLLSNEWGIEYDAPFKNVFR